MEGKGKAGGVDTGELWALREGLVSRQQILSQMWQQLTFVVSCGSPLTLAIPIRHYFHALPRLLVTSLSTFSANSIVPSSLLKQLSLNLARKNTKLAREHLK